MSAIDLNWQIPAIHSATDLLSGYGSNLFGESELGRAMGTLFSSGVSSVGNTLADNLLKGNTLTLGLGVNAGKSLAGAGVGLASNFIGKGINALGGDSRLSRGLGLGVATGLGTIGGRLITNGASNLFGTSKSIFSAVDGLKKATDAKEIANLSSKASAINPYALGMTIAGSALGAALGPSKEYGGKYGNITQTMDTIYDAASAAVNFIPGAGLFISAGMALNKGLSNLFGSTDGMTKQDAILGSAFMPAPVKWLNMAGAKTTSSFNKLSWQNTERTNSFMGNAFGNLGDKFDKARTEAGKTYGTFSQHDFKKALNNINFANQAWNKILSMTDLNELQNIRSLYMTSINNLKYALDIQGGFNPIYRGKQGMKVFNNAINHNMGMRLLSAAALIDNKTMILSAQGGTKVKKRPPLYRMGSYTPEELQLMDAYMREVEDKRKKRQQKIEEELLKAGKIFDAARRATGLTQLSVNSLIETGLKVLSGALEAAENLRQEKVEKLHEALKAIESTFMADLAVGAYPFLRRGFRWAFNRAGLLVTVPVQKTIRLKSGIIKSVLDNGKIRLSLPSHTDNKPRQFVLEPAGDNKYYVHMRMWDDIENKIPASNVTNEEKQQLFDALYDELPEGAEILFPKSGPGNYGTRGTVAGLQRLSRDPRFTPGTKGTLQYLDKDGKTVRTYEGTSFIKTENGWQGNTHVLDRTTLEGVLNFIDNDIIPRMLAQGHNVSSYTPTFRQFSPETDAFDKAMSESEAGAWFSPVSNDVTLRGPLEKQDFGLVIHEAGGHGLRYNMLPNYVPTKREYLNEYVITKGHNMSDEAVNALSKVHTGDQIFTPIEVLKLKESYPWVKTYFERNPASKSGDTVLRESGAVNTQFRGHYSDNGKIVGKELDEIIDKASPGVVLRDLIEQPYTASVVEDIAEITGKNPDTLQFYGPEMLEELVNLYPKLLEIVSKVKDTMKTVGSYGVPITVGGSAAATLYNTNK